MNDWADCLQILFTIYTDKMSTIYGMLWELHMGYADAFVSVYLCI